MGILPGKRVRNLLVSGHVNVDRFLKVRLFPAPDRTVPIVHHRVALGGPAATLALVAAGYGVKTGLVARLGDGFPVAFRQHLKRAGVDLRGLETVAGVTTPTCFIVEDEDGGQRTLIDQGPMGATRLARLPGRWMSEYSWVHLATGDPVYQLRLAAAARRAGLKVAVDPAQEIHYRWDRRQFAKLLSGSEILFGNRAEIDHATELVGGRGPESLLPRVPLVVRTDGESGATAFSRSGTCHVRAGRPRRIRSAVGAGDAFRGGFYAAWFEGEALPGCLTAGTRAAASWMEGPLGSVE